MRNVSSRSDGLAPSVQLYRPSLCRHRAGCSLTIGAGNRSRTNDSEVNSIHSQTLARSQHRSTPLRAGGDGRTRPTDTLERRCDRQGLTIPSPLTGTHTRGLRQLLRGVAAARLERFTRFSVDFPLDFLIRRTGQQAVRAKLASWSSIARLELEAGRGRGRVTAWRR